MDKTPLSASIGNLFHELRGAATFILSLYEVLDRELPDPARELPRDRPAAGRTRRTGADALGRARLWCAAALASVRADGGIVSTARDGILFLQAFMGGAIFPRSYLDQMQQQWRRIFTPLQYGMGIMRFELPHYFSTFRAAPPMVGHSGASGAVLFFAPEIDLFVSGTVNQIKKRSLPYNLMTRLVFACQDAWADARPA